MKTRYNIFKDNEAETWKYRFTWRGIYGDKLYFGITIFRFFEETNLQDELKGIKDVNTFRKKVGELARKYSDWCLKKEPHTVDEGKELVNFFIGALGEFFFCNLLDNVTSLLCVEKDNKGKHYIFNNVAPLLKGEKDFGVDATGTISDEKGDRNCVIQVKFWNPFTEEKIKLAVAEQAFAEGILHSHIKSEEKRNVVICWLGDESTSVSTYLKQNEEMWQHLVFIGKKSLDMTINGIDGNFWDGIADSLKKFSNQ